MSEKSMPEINRVTTAIPMLDLKRQYRAIKDEIDGAIKEVLENGLYISGPQVSDFEDDMAFFLGVKHAIGVASGTDALTLSLHALGIGPGDKVVVPSFTFYATAGAVSRLGGIPVFADIDPYTYNLDADHLQQLLDQEKDIKAVIPVHLFGLPCNMTRIMKLAEKYGFFVIEDACQAINAELKFEAKNVKAGTVGNTGCFSFFPSKNLGGIGDGGMVVTNDDKLADDLRILRTHGSRSKYHHQTIGYNSRLDTVQAAVLRVKLRYLQDWTRKRQAVAAAYDREFRSAGLDTLLRWPQVVAGHVFHQYVIESENRDGLAARLSQQGIASAVYYPIPLHLQECYRESGYKMGSLPAAENTSRRVLALPIDPELELDHLRQIVQVITDYVS